MMATPVTNRRAGGFTLIEMLVAITLLVLVLGMIMWPLLSGFAFMELGTARGDALAAAREAMDSMSRELAEAIYVFDPPADRSLLAFHLGEGNQPAPQEAGGLPVAVRYWRALRSPAAAYAPFWDPAADVWNGYYVARTEVPDPQVIDDDWNATATGTHPVIRALYRYPAGTEYPSGTAWPTAQPGWPWLEAYRLYPAGAEQRYQWYLDHAVGLTPNDEDFDVTQLEFTPRHVDNETLAASRPGGRWPPDYGLYRSRWPLWCRFSVWDETAGGFEERGAVHIYRLDPGTGQMELKYYTGLNAAGDVCLYDVDDPGVVLYNVESYPSRGSEAYAFGIDYDHGLLLFAFPATDSISSTGAESYTLSTVSGFSWGWVQPGSDHLKVDGVYYTRVSANPGPGQYTISMDDPEHDGTPNGWRVSFDSSAPPAAGAAIRVTYQYRNTNPNDLVIASYQTKGIIDIDLTVAKRDVGARDAARSRQEVHLTSAVKLHNVVK